jgi:two-component system, NarL family, response regulator NreC
MKILLADDHPTTRTGTKLYLADIPEITEILEAETGTEAFNLILREKPDIVLLDVRMPEMSGIEVLKKLKPYKYPTKIIGLSSFDNEEYIKRYQDFGAVGFMIKEEATPNTLKSLFHHLKHYDTFWMSQLLLTRLLQQRASLKEEHKLSISEIELIPLIAQGISREEIAEQRFKSVHTIKNQLESIKSKIGFNSYPELVAWAVRYILGAIDD